MFWWVQSTRRRVKNPNTRTEQTTAVRSPPNLTLSACSFEMAYNVYLTSKAEVFQNVRAAPCTACGSDLMDMSLVKIATRISRFHASEVNFSALGRPAQSHFSVSGRDWSKRQFPPTVIVRFTTPRSDSFGKLSTVAILSVQQQLLDSPCERRFSLILSECLRSTNLN